MIQKIIKKRTALMNFFKNESNKYTKEEILNKEFAVLSFSPTEEYIDSLTSPFDDLCVDMSTFNMDTADEVYMKGIITDIDKKNGYTIFHIQNKDAMASITASGPTLQKYEKYFIVGEPIIAKSSVYNGRLSLSLLIALNYIDEFEKEQNYISGASFDKIDSVMKGHTNDNKQYGVIVQCRLTKNKNDRDMVIGTLYDGNNIRGFATVKTPFNRVIPYTSVAGDFVRFDKPKIDFLLNNMEVVEL